MGQQVVNAQRVDWGVGTIVRVEALQHAGQPAQRVTARFSVGQKVVLVPPGVLTAPGQAPQRASGWIDQIGGRTLDDRLRALPESATLVLGSLRDKLLALAALYTHRDTPEGLARWARAQTGIGDPLSQYTRDELAEAFASFCAARDRQMRELLGRARRTDPDALPWLRERIEPETWEQLAADAR